MDCIYVWIRGNWIFKKYDDQEFYGELWHLIINTVNEDFEEGYSIDDIMNNLGYQKHGTLMRTPEEDNSD